MTTQKSSKKELILATAAKLLATQGGNNFSMRAVAEELGIRLSNLQYYYPSLEILFYSLVENILDLADKKLAAASSVEHDKIKALVYLVCAEIDDVYNCKLMWEIWALSERVTEASKAMSLFYQEYIKRIATIIRQQKVNLSEEEIERRAIMIVALLEGSLVIVGKKRNKVLIEHVKTDLLLTINMIINRP